MNEKKESKATYKNPESSKPLLVHIGFLPTVGASNLRDYDRDDIIKMLARENVRMEPRLKRLSDLEAIKSVFEFTSIKFDKSEKSTDLVVNEKDGILSLIDFDHF